ncbi:MAG: hypothetical protein HONBIEJF_00972 [Fimbriimonadaceae bacterium]|nr:hypothetical protein [Fimbriimonadaceae bacterium]
MPSEFPELIAALALFGTVVILPLVFMLLRHQRAIASMIHEKPGEEARKRIEALEAEVKELKFAVYIRSLEPTNSGDLRH